MSQFLGFVWRNSSEKDNFSMAHDLHEQSLLAVTAADVPATPTALSHASLEVLTPLLLSGILDAQHDVGCCYFAAVKEVEVSIKR